MKKQAAASQSDEDRVQADKLVKEKQALQKELDTAKHTIESAEDTIKGAL